MATQQCRSKAVALVRDRPAPAAQLLNQKPLTEINGIPATDRIIPFGEYKGKSLGSLPSGYLGWIAENLKFRDGPKRIFAQLAEGVLQIRREARNAEINLKKKITSTVSANFKDTSMENALQQIQRQDVLDPVVVYGSLLKRCCDQKSLEEGRIIHKHMVDSNLMWNRYLGNLLVHMYAKCGQLDEARAVFDNLTSRNERSYGIMISALVKGGKAMEALELWEDMEAEGVVADKVAVTSIIASCTKLKALEEARAIHEHIVVTGFKTDNKLETGFLQMYAKCGSLEDARRVFEGMSFRDVFCWTAMISAYARAGQGEMALILYRRMIAEGVEPNIVTYACALAGCASVGALADGRMIHKRISTSNVIQDEVLQDALLNMYIKCGDLAEAKKVFNGMWSRNARSYTAMISALIQEGEYGEAFKLYREMEVEPNAFTYSSVLGAAEGLGDLELGRGIHKKAASFDKNLAVQNALVTMYGKCGSPSEARSVFNSMEPSTRNVISWTSMIEAYVQAGDSHEALYLFKRMDVEPNAVTFASALNACGMLGALEYGHEIHRRITALGFKSPLVECSLVSMYARCGCLGEARGVFLQRKVKDVFICNAMLGAYTYHGYVRSALYLYRKMEQEGISPDLTTLTSLLVACGHTRLLDDCHRLFQSFVVDHKATPQVEHYLCMIDALGCSNKLDYAKELVETMPYESDAAAWTRLLCSCKLHGDIERAEKAAEHVFRMAPNEQLPYTLLCEMYSSKGRQDDVQRLNRKMVEAGLKLSTPVSYIEVGKELYGFANEDGFIMEKVRETHGFTMENVRKLDNAAMEKVRSLLTGLLEPMKQSGYVANTRDVCFHSERVATGYGLIAGDDNEEPLRVFSNVRVCSDCHVAVKLISDIVERKIVLRDVNRFHHFEKGVCSCGDHW